MSKVQDSNVSFLLTLSVSLLVVTVLTFALPNPPFIAQQLGLSTAASLGLAQALKTVGTVATAITVIGTFTGVGTIGSSLAAVILHKVKKEGAKKAAAF